MIPAVPSEDQIETNKYKCVGYSSANARESDEQVMENTPSVEFEPAHFQGVAAQKWH